jgi:hypothetical protein
MGKKNTKKESTKKRDANASLFKILANFLIL